MVVLAVGNNHRGYDRVVPVPHQRCVRTCKTDTAQSPLCEGECCKREGRAVNPVYDCDKLKKGYRVTEVLREGDWVKVTLDTGKAAWIHASLLSAKLQVGSGDRITILTAENRARLCPRPDCGEGRELLRMPTNTKLRVLGSYTQHQPIFDVTWYKVKYQEKEGWVSEFNTDKARDVTQRR